MAEQQSKVHGTLHATIYEVDRLYTTGGPWNFIQKLSKRIMGARVSQVYVTIDLGNVGVGRTSKLDNQDLNPRWYQTFHIYCAHEASHLVFSLKQDNPIGATVVGRAHLPIQKLREEAELDTWLDLLHDDRTPINGAPPKLHVKLRFLDATQEPNWSQGIKSPKFPGVPHTFFPQRKGCRVVLYQDAHVPSKFIPEIPLFGGKYYEPHQCWEDMFHAISNAKHLIYITGWSVYTKIALVRHSRGELLEEKKKTLPLGELLKKKASEGVRVLMLLWEDRTSVKLLRKDGLMSTHGEDTWKYFYGSGVHCVLCPRNPDNGLTIVQDIEVSTMFTHHQKSVVVDCELPNGGSERRRIMGFIGGFDLCDGRYDTPTHSIFRTLDTVHRDDFRQANFPNASLTKGGPREPWHDVHCRLEGPIAWDILFNFEQRWRKQGAKDVLVNLRELEGVVIPPSPVMFAEDTESWNVQLFRSIDGGAAFGFPDSPEDAARAGLVCGNDHVIDRSVQDAYINAIRRAKSFIYIENQYFLGSSFCWSSNDIKVEDVGALHLIPKELSLKIVSKIEAGERFSVYVVIPMWPEGVPESSCAQVILNWQKTTMKSMYSDIARALQAKGLEANPKDYLSFFCLGNREKKRHGEYEPPERPDHGTNYHRAQQSRRFMIYVHAKLMIVDDEYIITGSANINQRSMDGARDSEIAMGAYQPHHLASKQPARGQIHGFRMALWYEHLGLIDDSFLMPETLDCVRKVNQLAERNWNLYTCERMDHDLPGHLLSYPICVTGTGDVAVLPGSEFFPDTKAPVLGSKSEYIPPMLTT